MNIMVRPVYGYDITVRVIVHTGRDTARGDGFGPVAVGDVVVVGLSLLAPLPLEAAHETIEGHVVLDG